MCQTWRRRATAYIDDCEYLSKVTIVIWLLCINLVATGRVQSQCGQIKIKPVSGGQVTALLNTVLWPCSNLIYKSSASWEENRIVTKGRVTEILTFSGPPQEARQPRTGPWLGFWEIENGRGGMPVKWQPLWHPCLPIIYRGGPASSIISTNHKKVL